MDPLLTLQALGKPARYKARQRIYAKGAQAREVFILNSGEALNIVVSADGHELVLQRVCPGDIVPMTGLLGDAIYQTDCVAQVDCEFTRVPVPALRTILQSDPVLSFYVLEIALKRLRHRSQQLTDTAFLPVRSRLSKWLLQRLEEKGSAQNNAVLDLNGSERLIGLALGGVSRETVSRHLSALVQAQVIARSGKKITIRDVAKLRAMM
jgi:CRP-like cAMP-binding protein